MKLIFQVLSASNIPAIPCVSVCTNLKMHLFYRGSEMNKEPPYNKGRERVGRSTRISLIHPLIFELVDVAWNVSCMQKRKGENRFVGQVMTKNKTSVTMG